MLTIQSDNGKQGYKVGGKKYCLPKVVLSRQPWRPIWQRLDSETRGILSSQRGGAHCLDSCLSQALFAVEQWGGAYPLSPHLPSGSAPGYTVGRPNTGAVIEQRAHLQKRTQSS